MNKTLIVFSVLVILASCNNADEKNQTASKETETIKDIAPQFRGEVFDAELYGSAANLQAELKKEDSVITTIKAKVDQVCQAKGCWMTVQLPEGETMRVTFEDYGFFVPKDLGGKEVIMKGVAKIEETDVETLKHYAKDAGKSQEEIDAISEPQMDYTFLASGVKLPE